MLHDRSSQRGQALALFALALTAMVLGVAVVVDGGYAFAQRREAQNAADFAAMAGTRIVGQKLTGHPPGAGTAANVETPSSLSSPPTMPSWSARSTSMRPATRSPAATSWRPAPSPATPSASSSTPGPTGSRSCWGSSASSTGRPRRRPPPSRPARASAAASCRSASRTIPTTTWSSAPSPTSTPASTRT